jgi:hypothetical protein
MARRRRAWVAGTLALAAALAGCGGDARPSARRTAEPAPSSCEGPAASTRCFGLPRHLVPVGADATAWRLDGRTFLVTWTVYKHSDYAVWRRRDGRWRRLFRSPEVGPDGPSAVDLADVNEDRRRDVLVQGEAGSGGCGPRDVLAIGATRVTLLFHRANGCEVYSELRNHLLRYRETIGPCPDDPRGRAHCYGGVRTIVRGWSGRRVVTNRSFVRCVRRDLDPRRDCRRR